MLGDSLKVNLSMEIISLFGTKIGNVGAGGLTGALVSNLALQKIKLFCNPLFNIQYSTTRIFCEIFL